MEIKWSFILYDPDLFAGCPGWMDGLPEIVALFGTNLQLWGHQQTAACGREEIPNHGTHVEEINEECEWKHTSIWNIVVNSASKTLFFI